MMEIKDLTEWFPGNVKPNFIGVYEAKSIVDPSGTWYAYWAGEGWLPCYRTVQYSFNHRNYDALARHQDKVWRGLARPVE